MISERKFRPYLISLNCEDINTSKFSRNLYKHINTLQATKQFWERPQLSKKFQYLKYVNSLHVAISKYWPKKCTRWFNWAAKSVRKLRAPKATGQLTRNFLSKFPCTNLRYVTIRYSRYSFKWTKYLMRTLEELGLSISDFFDHRTEKELSKLQRLFLRGPSIKKCYLDALGCQTIGLVYLQESMMKAKNIQYEINLDFDKLKYERLEPLQALERNLGIHCNMNFADFKMQMKKTMEQLHGVKFKIDFGRDKKQLLTINMMSKFTYLQTAFLDFYQNWSNLHIRQILDNIKLPPSLKELTLQFRGCYDYNDPFGKDDPLVSNYEELTSIVKKLDELKMIRAFLKELTKLTNLEKFDFCLEHYSEQVPMYYYLIYAICTKLQKSVKEVNIMMQFDKVFKQKENKLNLDLPYLLSCFQFPESIIDISLVGYKFNFEHAEKFKGLPNLMNFQVETAEIEDLVDRSKVDLVFKTLLKSDKIEQLLFPFVNNEIIKALARSKGLQHLNLLQLLGNDGDTIDDEEVLLEFVESMCGKRFLKKIVVVSSIEAEQDVLDQCLKIVKASRIEKVIVGEAGDYAIAKDGKGLGFQNVDLNDSDSDDGGLNIFQAI